MIRTEPWFREAVSPDLQFEEAVETYRRAWDVPSLLRVLQLSLRSGSGLLGIRSPQRVRARELLLDYGLVELRGAFPEGEGINLQVIPAFNAPLGKVGPNLQIAFQTTFRRSRVVETILSVYPHIQSTLETGEPSFSLSDVRNGYGLRKIFLKMHSIPEIIKILRKARV